MMQRNVLTGAVRVLALSAALLATAAAAGCEGDGGGSTRKLALQLYAPPPTYPDPFANVGYLRVIASGTGFDARDTFMVFDDHTGVLPDIPFARDIQVTVEGRTRVCQPRPGVDASACQQQGICDSPSSPCDWTPGDVVSRGRTGRLLIDAGTAAFELAVFMMQTDSFAPTTDRNGAPSRLITPRVGATATLLEDGKVLIVGGGALAAGAADLGDPAGLSSVYATAELYDPRTGEFEDLTRPGFDSTKLFSARAWHQAVLLPDPNGPDRVAIFGGFSRVNDQIVPIASVEIFDPSTLSFVHDGVPPMTGPRALHTATKIDERGRVLLVGGWDAGGASWELWDPASGPVANGPLNARRWNHTATFVPNAYSGFDVVFLLGGEDATSVHNSGELYLVQNQEVPVGLIPLIGPEPNAPDRAQPRTLHQTVWLKGQGLIYTIGGYQDKARTQPLDRVDVFTVNCPIPEGGDIGDCWRRDVGFRLESARGYHSATEIPGNAILIAGGCGDFHAGEPCNVGRTEVIFQTDRIVERPDGTQEVQHEVKIGFTRADPIWPRAAHQALRLQSQHVLLLGGLRVDGAGRTMVQDTELFNPL
jgi:hypothetical protein